MTTKFTVSEMAGLPITMGAVITKEGVKISPLASKSPYPLYGFLGKFFSS